MKPAAFWTHSFQQEQKSVLQQTIDSCHKHRSPGNVQSKYNEKLLEEENMRKEMNKMKALIEKQKTEKEAKELGYPSNFEYYHRTGSKTNQSKAYVITPEGELRLNDDVILSNSNHIHKNNYLYNADGTQIWNQILPGELIIAFTKEYTAAPMNCTVEWVPEKIIPAQLEKVEEITKELKNTYEKDIGLSGKECPEIEGWKKLLENAVYSLEKENKVKENQSSTDEGIDL